MCSQAEITCCHSTIQSIQAPGQCHQTAYSLAGQLAKFHNLQAIYQPELATAIAPSDDDVIDVLLQLLSSLPPEVRVNCAPKLVLMEKKLQLS